MQSETIKLDPEVAVLAGKIDFDPDALQNKYLAERDKRLRADGNEQYVEVKAEFSRYVDDPYVEPGFTREPVFDDVEVAIIGGGFGGLLMGARLREAGLRAASASSRRPATSAAPGTGTAIPARCATSSPTSTCRCSKSSATCRSTSTPSRRRSSSTAAASPGTTDLYDDALFQTAITELRWDEAAQRWIITHRPRRPLHGAVRRDGQRAAQPAEAARHPRHQRVQGPHLPHQPLGLRYTGGDSHRRPDRAAGQARRHHRHRRHRDPVHPAPRRVGEAALRLPAHAVVGRRAQQRRDRSGVGRVAAARLAAAAAWTTSTSWSAAATRTRTWSTTAGPTSSAT